MVSGWSLILFFFSIYFYYFFFNCRIKGPSGIVHTPILAFQPFFFFSLAFLRFWNSSQSILFMWKLLPSFTKPCSSTLVLFLSCSKNSFICWDWMTPWFPFPPLLISLQEAERHWGLPALAEEDFSLPSSFLDAQCPAMWSLGFMEMFKLVLKAAGWVIPPQKLGHYLTQSQALGFFYS